jgi:Mn2+/Fe2+ NRAMP family transporter
MTAESNARNEGGPAGLAGRMPDAPRGRDRLKWMGPGIIWMTSAIATGELIFTPRIASLYGYAVLWILVLAIALKALIAREIGRYAVVAGGSLLGGLQDLPGPRNWAVWVLIVPQLLVAVTTVVGMVGATSSAIILLLPGGFVPWAMVALVSSLVLVAVGRYRGVELISIIMSLSITIALVVTAGLLFPAPAVIAEGLVPSVEGLDLGEILPWIGFMMSGAAGLVWFSYWLSARGFGAASGEQRSEEAPPGGGYRERYQALDAGEVSRARSWIRLMTAATAISSVLILVLLVSLLILGAELLRPEGLIPEGDAVTDVLSRLLGEVWGPVGMWTMILAAFIAFWSSVITNLDGWSRMFTEGLSLMFRQLVPASSGISPRALRFGLLFGLLGVLPAVAIIVRPEPVEFLILAGSIEAVQIPFVAAATLYLNVRRLPPGVRPSKATIGAMAISISFFVFFAFYYLFDTIIA